MIIKYYKNFGKNQNVGRLIGTDQFLNHIIVSFWRDVLAVDKSIDI